MDETLKKIYQDHHQVNRKAGFSLLGEERGKLISRIIGTGKKVLDIGCRDGSLTRHFWEGNSITGLDIDAKALQAANENLRIKTIYCDLNGEWDELAGEKFDAVVAGEILEHLYFPEKVLKRIQAHLNDEGIFLGSVPNAFSLKNRIRYFLGRKKNTPLDDPTHINQFSYKEIKNLLGKFFKEVEIIGLGRYKVLSKISPSFFAFDLFFIGRGSKSSLEADSNKG